MYEYSEEKQKDLDEYRGIKRKGRFVSTLNNKRSKYIVPETKSDMTDEQRQADADFGMDLDIGSK